MSRALTSRLLLTIAASALVAGCGGASTTGPALGPTEPLAMLPGTASLAGRWYAEWLEQPNLRGGDGVVEMSIVSRPIRSPIRGESRLLCRLVLHDGDGKPLRSDGPVRMILIARPNLPGERFVGGWSITAAEAGRRYRYGLLPGYQLDLHWPAEKDTNMYRLVCQWTDATGRSRQTRAITFEDTFGYEAPARELR